MSELEQLLNQPVAQELETTSAANIEVNILAEQIGAAKRRDFVAHSGDMRVSQCPSLGKREGDDYTIHIGDKYQFGMSPFCVKQLNQRLSAGFGRYAQELDERDMSDLYLRNVNELLERDDRKNQIRVLENGRTYARAVVSDKYQVIDDDLVFAAAFNVIGDHLHKFKPIGGNRTDTNTYCKFVSINPVFEVNVGGKNRPFSAGFIISNSEVGQSSAQFSAFFTDSYCDNGIIFKKSVIAECKFRHVGAQISTDFGELIGDRVNSVKRAEYHALITEASQIACLQDAAMLEPIKQAIVAASERKLAGDEIGSIKNVLNKVGVAKADHDHVIRELDGADNSQFGIQAALTQFAQKVGSYEKRIELEQKGGDIIELSEKQWCYLQAM